MTISRAALLALGSLLYQPDPTRAYDAEAGRQKAEAACAGCHGPDGNSQIPEVPSLAGQLPRYLILALFQFRIGHRKSEQMSPFAAELTDDDLGNLAAYYAAQKPMPPVRAIDPQNPKAARVLTEANHCTQCHGPDLAGQEHIPRLAGQHSEYLKQQLLGFRAATRGDVDGNMTSAAQPLSDSEIATLADYIAGLAATSGP